MSSMCLFHKRISLSLLSAHKELSINILKCGRRTLLSDSYNFTNETQQLTDLPNASDISKISLSLDRCHERNMPVSSVMIDKLVRAIATEKQLRGSLYYLHKFRHTDNCYFLQPWTTYTLTEKCLSYNPSVLLDLLKSKTHYGIFPNFISLNRCLSHFLKQNNTKEALQVACELFLLELLENKSSQCLAVHTVNKYIEENKEVEEVLPKFDNPELKRNIGGILHVVGQISSNPSLFILGQSILGSLEIEHGIRSVYQEPWAPLGWNDGYLLRGLEYLESISTPISQQSMNLFLETLKGNKDLEIKAENVVRDLKKHNLISNDTSLKLDEISKSMIENLPSHEQVDIDSFNKEIQNWKEDSQLWTECCNKITDKYNEERKQKTIEDNLEKTAHAMAVAKLGFWDMSKTRTKHVDEEIAFYLREDYVNGAMSDLDILDLYRAEKGSEKEAYIKMS